ncbi:MAG: cupredoxin domain-containing protein [Gemmatimonadaceae bacterium]
MRRVSGSIAVFFLATGLMSCGGGGDGGVTNPPPPTCGVNTFCMGAATFYTAAGTNVTTLTVPANTPVTWDNNSGGIEHDVAFDDPSSALAVGSGSSGQIGANTSGSYQRQFAVSGSTHPFHCIIHGLPMHGTVIIQ